MLRLQLAARTVASLATALVILYLLTKVTGQPVTVALLGAVIAMVSAMSINEPDPRRQKITMALLAVPAAVAITVAALLDPYQIVADAVFVVIVFAVVYVRRFGKRAMALGMAAFMGYFFALFLGATSAQLPVLIAAVAVGAACSFLIRAYVLPDRPERVLRLTVRALRGRIAGVIDTTGDVLQAGRFGQRQQRRLQARIARLNVTAAMVEDQLDDKVDSAMLWPGIADDELAVRLFNAELAAERLAVAGGRAATVATDMPVVTCARLAEALRQLAMAVREPGGGLHRVTDLAEELADTRVPDGVGEDEVYRLARSIAAMARAAAEVRELVERAATGSGAVGESTLRSSPAEAEAGTDEDERVSGLRPTTRQAIQVAVAASLAIMAGQLVSPDRWYWAVIAAFVVFTGTTSRGEAITRGWHRLLGTVLGVSAGMLLATAFGGHTVALIVLIFVCLFFGFYFFTVAYSLMTFWITTMLALFYGLLGEFSVDVLVLRIEETAVGAIIGVAAAVLILPIRTVTSVREGAHAFLTTLSELIDASVENLFGGDATASATEKARRLHRQLQQLRVSAKPLTSRAAGIVGRGSIRRGVRALTVCDHHARILARCSDQPYSAASSSPGLVEVVASSAVRIRRNIEVLATIGDDPEPKATVLAATDLLDTADTLAGSRPGGSTPGLTPSDSRSHCTRCAELTTPLSIWPSNAALLRQSRIGS